MNMKKLVMSLVVTGITASMLCLSAIAAVAELGGTEFDTVQAAVDAAVAGDNEIQLLADEDGIIDENVFILQQKGINITIKGSEDIVYTGGFEICGNNRSYTCESGSPAAETLTFDGINFNGEDKTAAFDFIGSSRKNTLPNGVLVWAYPHNVTVKNCSFIGNYDVSFSDAEYAGKEVVALRNVGGYNWTVENCTGTGLHSFMQSSANTLTSSIDKLTVTESKSGLNLGTNANYTITNSTFDVVEYAVRADANSDRDVDFVMTGCEVNAAEALIFRKADSAKFTYDVVLENNKIEATVADITRGGAAAAGDTMTFDIDNNYWGGDAPVIDEIKTIENAVPNAFYYYLDEEMTELGGVEATYGGVNYATLADAIAAADKTKTAEENVIDLLGNTIVIDVYKDSYHAGKSLTFTNGTLDFSYAGAPTALFWLSDSQKLIFDDVDIIKLDVGTDRKFMYNLIQIASAKASVSFIDCNIDLDGGYDSTNKVGMASSYIANDGNGTMYFTRCNIECEYTNFVYRGGATFDTCTFDGYAERDDGEDIAGSGNIIMWAANPCVIKNSTVKTRTLGVINANGTIDIVDGSVVDTERVRHYYASSSASYTTNMVTVDATSTLTADRIDSGLIDEENSAGSVLDEGETLIVKFVEVESEDALDNSVYNIVIADKRGNKINRLNSADLTFVLNPEDDMAYEIVAVNEEIAINTVDNSNDRYEFHYESKTSGEATTDSLAEIILGQVRFTGYGKYTFGVDTNATTNLANATKYDDNIVDTFIPSGDITKGESALEYADGIDSEIVAPTSNLKIVVDFPNAIENGDINVIEYQDMMVTVTGEDIADIVIHLGSDKAYETVLEQNNKSDEKYTVEFVDGAYVINILNTLTQNTAYAVTVEGAGYRTARYTVNMQEAESKTLNFWNNVKDNAIEVEEGKDSSKQNVTFLAGDIVKDGTINIYDLSAVVSYFGEVDLNKLGAANDYVKYDLNRDGKIDSKDVAYVLVSWNR